MASRCESGLRLVAVLLALLSGCAPSSRLGTNVLQPSYAVSRDGQLQYRLPVGWFDATADTQAVGHAVWLMRSDYGATLAVDEVRLDPGARQVVGGGEGGLLQLAQLVISLTAGDRGAVLIDAPVAVRLNSRTVCRYTLLVSDRKDTLYVILVDTGRNTYTVTVLRSEKHQGQGIPLGVVADNFVAALRW